MSTIHVVAAAVVVGDRCLIGQRQDHGSFGGHWEFPGGKPEPGETQIEALARELKEELDLDARIGAWLARGIATASTRTIVLDIYLAYPIDPANRILRREHQALRFVGAHELDEYLIAPADLPAVPGLKMWLKHAMPAPLPEILDGTR